MRHYGLQLGDRVRLSAFGTAFDGVVEAFDWTDNNRAVLRLDDGSKREVVAEWCEVLARPPTHAT